MAQRQRRLRRGTSVRRHTSEGTDTCLQIYNIPLIVSEGQKLVPWSQTDLEKTFTQWSTDEVKVTLVLKNSDDLLFSIDWSCSVTLVRRLIFSYNGIFPSTVLCSHLKAAMSQKIWAVNSTCTRINVWIGLYPCFRQTSSESFSLVEFGLFSERCGDLSLENGLSVFRAGIFTASCPPRCFD